MLKSLYSGISGMKSQQIKMDVIGNNIANVGTTAYKKQTVRFSDTLYQGQINSSGSSKNYGGINPSQIGLGVKVAGISKTFTQGSLQTTGRSTDVAIDGDGFFVVAKGDLNNPDDIEYQYTRDGSFSIDEDGHLVTADGWRVMGKALDKNGDPTGDLIPITIPNVLSVDDGTGTNTMVDKRVVAFNISVNGNGVVTVTLEDSSKHDISKLELALFINPEGMENVGGNRYLPTTNSGDVTFLTDGDSKAFGWINQGYVEMSNVDLSEEFTDMIVTQRSFQANSKIITTSDELIQEVLGLKR